MKALVVGFGVTGESVARHLQAEGHDVFVVDDAPRAEPDPRAAHLGLDVLRAPNARVLASLVADVDVVVLSPGVPWDHAVRAAAVAASVPVTGDVDLAADRAKAPFVAVTGTNGKTTVTTLVAAMLVGAGVRAVAAGNIGLPILDAAARDVDVVVVELSSFQLELAERFRPVVGTWLNLSPDHRDAHPSHEAYARAKARIWAHQETGDVAVANAGDQAVMTYACAAAGRGVRLVTFGPGGDWRAEGGHLRAPDGEAVMAVRDLPRSFPHDVDNALAALATAVEAGATVTAGAEALARFQGLPHRVQRVASGGGVDWYDDSKATTPASVLAALAGFDSVVLLAGGRNKGLDLSVLAAEAGRLRATVAMGEAAPEVVAALDGACPVVVAGSMAEAVALAADAARPGDAVVLSPGCASFDWYHNYAERGDDFTRLARQQASAMLSPPISNLHAGEVTDDEERGPRDA